MTQTRTPAPTRTPARIRTPAPADVSQRRPRLEPAGPVRLTGRGALMALFALSFLSLLMAAWTGWSTIADAAFVCSCGVVTYFTRASGLRMVMVSPPLLFFMGCVCAQAATSSGAFMAAERTLVTLGTSAPWLFTGTALAVAVALSRGYRPRIPRLPGRSAVDYLHHAVRDRRIPK
jgi:hypothetical protein